MSGSTIGGVVGGAIGLYFGNPQLGWMIGSVIGGYVDPDVIKGPRLQDAQVQTSSEGVPRPIVYGTAVVAGNIIMCGPLVETKRRERTGKGGPVQESYAYSRTFAIRVCEGPVSGIRRIWMDDKCVYDARDPSTPDDGTDQATWAAAIQAVAADTAAFGTKISIFLGDETQLPSPVLEALPAANGGGSGNVPAFRGTCYVVFDNLDLTDRQGTVPQFRFEVVSAGSTATTTNEATIGAHTHSKALTGVARSAFIETDPDDPASIRYWIDPVSGVAPDDDVTTGVLDAALTETSGNTLTNEGDTPGDTRIWSYGHHVYGFLFKSTWTLAADDNATLSSLDLLHNGSFVAQLRPTLGSAATWFYGEAAQQGGARVAFSPSTDAVYLAVGTASVAYNRIYKWPLQDFSGGVVAAMSTSEEITAGGLNANFWFHMDRSGLCHAIAEDEAEWVRYDADLGELGRTALPMSLTGLRAFAVDSGMLILAHNNAPGSSDTTLYFYSQAGFTLVGTVTVSQPFDSQNWQIVCTDGSIFLRAGRYIKRIAYQPYCYASPPQGWHALPDAPGYITDGTSVVPLCSTTRNQVSSDDVILSDVVTDLCERVGLTASQLEVSQLTDVVRGFVVGKQMPAADAIRSLQQAYFFDFPEWGNHTDLGTKLRGIKRGGASVFAIGEDDLVESDDDQETRAQAVEFPRKINLITSDPASNYEPIKQTAERATENVRAVGEQTIELPVVMTRAEAAVTADKMLKIAWEEAAGRLERELPEEFSQYVPSDCGTYGGKRWRIEQSTLLDGSSQWKLVRDRASAYTSNATAGSGVTPSVPTSGMRGPTLFTAFNSVQLRTQDNSPGVYVGVRGRLSGWIGCDLQMSVDDGASFATVARLTTPATLGYLLDPCASSGEPITVATYGDTLESVTASQVAAGLNAFALVTNDVAEIISAQTVTDDGSYRFELEDVTRGQAGSTATAHSIGDDVMLLDSGLYFLPLDISLAGRTLIFRPVTLGTAEANAEEYEFVFMPQFTSTPAIDFLETELGEVITAESGDYLRTE